MEESRRCSDESLRNHVSHLHELQRFRSLGKQAIRHFPYVPEQSELLIIFRHIQASDSKIFCGYIHEMDIPVLRTDVSSSFIQGGRKSFVDTDSYSPDVGTRISDRICHIRELFPHSFRAETHTSDPCKHVQLYPADHCYSHQHNPQNGYRHMAENTCSPVGICRYIRSKPESESNVTY